MNPLQLPADDILKPLHSLGSRPGPDRSLSLAQRSLRLCPETEGDWVFPAPGQTNPTILWLAPEEGAQGCGGSAPLGVQQKLMPSHQHRDHDEVYGVAFMEAKRKTNTSVLQRVLLQDHTK